MSGSPAYASIPNPGTPVTLTTGDTATDGTGGNTQLVFTAGAAGSFLPKLRLKALGNTGAQSLLRVFRNNGSTPATAGNNALIKELTLAQVTISHTAENQEYSLELNLSLAANERIYVCVATTVTNGWRVTPVNGGNY
jgi:hypothetical protein